MTLSTSAVGLSAAAMNRAAHFDDGLVGEGLEQYPKDGSIEDSATNNNPTSQG